MASVFLVLFVSFAVASPLLSSDEYESLFSQWVGEQQKFYPTPSEFFTRFHIFQNNLDYVISNNNKNGIQLRINQFADLTSDEFRSFYTGSKELIVEPKEAKILDDSNLPASIDWRTQGAVTPIKNQGQCGSCWAFSAIAAVEGIYAINTGSLVSFSEQMLVDCSHDLNFGCSGGFSSFAMGWIHRNGICTEESYPYTAESGKCKKSECSIIKKFSGYETVSHDKCTQLAAAVAKQPVAVYVDAAGSDWQFYGGGILSDSNCGTHLDHGVAVVGYGTEGSQEFWIVKNSWGPSWGEQGFIRILKEDDKTSGICGICKHGYYPTM